MASVARHGKVVPRSRRARKEVAARASYSGGVSAREPSFFPKSFSVLVLSRKEGMRVRNYGTTHLRDAWIRSLSFVASALGLTVRKSTFEEPIASDDEQCVKVNGFSCKAETNVTEADFFFAGLAKPGVINNTLGSLVIAANVEKIPRLNTLGVSFSRIDYKAGGLNPPHTRPHATEILFVLDGQLDMGFITTANKLISKSIKKGEISVFPKGLVHSQKNSGDKPALVLSAFNSQLPAFNNQLPAFSSQLPRTFFVVAALLPKNHSTASV
ncbi:germin-like protein subfamily 2 member 2 [Vigna umbellata]|uniref:germin-like protein subfamily 2 member 2 n=1 Tax=Vigna umbellata TaxID=87088 RepID=UPI001F5F3BB7|nr:germin-like protein subfamily 2 member 2 [Vigna umbellata]XP_047169564.1 germin-like protein subfamily 2 member 2 [Vigna umbellata]